MKELKFTQTRNRFTELSTTSEVTLDGKLVCYFLEDKDRDLTKSMSEADTAKIKIKTKIIIQTMFCSFRCAKCKRFR